MIDDDQLYDGQIPIKDLDNDERHTFLELKKKSLAISKQNMLKSLEKFKNESGELRKIKQDRNQEQLMTNRLIKNEVIDIADRLEIMHTLMSKQTNQMNHLAYKVERLYNNQSIYDDDDGEYGEESEEDQGEGMDES